MGNTTETEGNRTSVSSKWGPSYSSTQTRAFKNPGRLSYRNAALITLLHSPLLLNWIEEVHPARHSCGTTNMSLLCAMHHLIGFYWFGDMQRGTHEICMVRVWNKLLETTWTDVNPDKGHDIKDFLGAFFEQLTMEMKIDADKYWELQRIVRVCLKTHLVCKECGIETPAGDERLYLRASFPEINGQPPWYDVTEAIQHNLEQATLPWACDKCLRSNKHNGSTEPTLSTKHIEKLPQILFVDVAYYGHRGQLNGRLKVDDTLVISNELRYPGSPNEGAIRYELYSIIFHKKAATDDEYTSAVKGPGGKWAHVKTEFITDELTLDKLLDTADAQQLARILAYRRIPLNGMPSRPAVPKVPIQTAAIAPMPRQDQPSTPIAQVAGGSGVALEQVINLRDGIEWTVKQHLPLPVGVDRLLDLKGKARTQHAKFRLTFTSPETGEVLEGEAYISLTQKNKRKANVRDGPPKKRGRPLGSKTGTGIAKKKAEPKRAKTPDPPIVTVLGVPRPGEATLPKVVSSLVEESQRPDGTEESEPPIVVVLEGSSPDEEIEDEAADEAGASPVGKMDIDDQDSKAKGLTVPEGPTDIQPASTMLDDSDDDSEPVRPYARSARPMALVPKS
ncbi:hypothetical protein BJX66DRAFT_271351 [Aspergillus keveii]|uniref:USP domain-containing protein n=1 Tax=Aspergillus keveii TaxID=714993 RepID=A0ABR4FY36_9EURO